MYADITNALQARATQKSSVTAKSSTTEAKPAPDTGKALPQETQAKQAEEAKQSSSPSNITELVSNINTKLQQLRRELHFSVDTDTGRTVVKVINSDTDEVVRQIPSEEVIRLARSLDNGGAFILDTEV